MDAALAANTRVIGLRQLLGIETKLAVTASLINAAVGIPVLALFAR